MDDILAALTLSSEDKDDSGSDVKSLATALGAAGAELLDDPGVDAVARGQVAHAMGHARAAAGANLSTLAVRVQLVEEIQRDADEMTFAGSAEDVAKHAGRLGSRGQEAAWKREPSKDIGGPKCPDVGCHLSWCATTDNGQTPLRTWSTTTAAGSPTSGARRRNPTQPRCRRRHNAER